MSFADRNSLPFEKVTLKNSGTDDDVELKYWIQSRIGRAGKMRAKSTST